MRNAFALFAIKLRKIASPGQRQKLLIATLGSPQSGKSRNRSGRKKLRSRSILKSLVRLLQAGDSKTTPGITELGSRRASNHLQDGAILGLSLRLDDQILGAGMRLLQQSRLATIQEHPLRGDGEAIMMLLQ